MQTTAAGATDKEGKATVKIYHDHPVERVQQCVIDFMKTYHNQIRVVVKCSAVLIYLVYLTCAIRYNSQLAQPLIVITSFVIFCYTYCLIRDHLGTWISQHLFDPCHKFLGSNWHVLKWWVYSILLIAVVLYLALVVITTFRQIQSIVGLILFMLIPLLTCKHPTKIRWRPIVWGFALQFILGVLVLRWRPGYEAIKWMSIQLNKFLAYSMEGAGKVFGNPWFLLHAFFMFVIPLVVWIGAVVAIMYFYGWIQEISAKLGWLMKLTLQTTAIESITLGANIFLSVLDTMLMIKDYIPLLTTSEFHCFLVGAHSTIAGFAFGIFVLFGVQPQHLLTAAVMSAPAAVAVAKLNYPETQKSQLDNEENMYLQRGTDLNVYQATANGAWAAAKSTAVILIQVLVFMALYILVDDFVRWLSHFVGQDLSIGELLGYLFMPLAYLMGVDKEDLYEVGSMMGLKIVANEFLGYILLGRYYVTGRISERSAAIATYAMCGFSSFGTLVIFVGVWKAVDNSKTKEVSAWTMRLLMNCNIACFITACVASILYDENIVQADDYSATKFVNVTFKILAGGPTHNNILSSLGLENLGPIR